MPLPTALPRTLSRRLPWLLMAASLSSAPAWAEAPGRWQSSFEAFEAADRVRTPAPGGVVFVGSSSIRLWDGLERQFDLADKGSIVKRGFGGSLMSDCRAHVARLVLPYKPRLVIVYAGDNDLAEGRSPSQVRDDFAGFVQAVHTALPDTRIAYVSIKPSPLRVALLPRVREANGLIAAYAQEMAGLHYIDVFTPMLDTAGQPRSDLYGSDSLHLNSTGYALWQRLIAPYLAPASPVRDAVAAAR
jgi:lysophospholipase L1-like esterase